MQQDGEFNVSTQDQQEPSEFLTIFSVIIGYSYAFAWAISFMSQIHLNYKLKNVEGCNFDFVSYNISGFFFYVAYTAAGYFYPDQTGITTESNDLFFASFTLILCLIIGYQCYFQYEKGQNKITNLGKLVNFTYWSTTIIHYSCYAIFNIYEITSVYQNVWYYMSYIKLVITLTKYLPQVYWNYSRKSTKGWSHVAVIYDYVGSWLVTFQILLEYYNGDSSALGNSESHSGLNIAKFGLSWISLFFDTIFLIQHYVFYNPKNEKKKLVEEDEQKDVDAQKDLQKDIELAKAKQNPEDDNKYKTDEDEIVTANESSTYQKVNTVGKKQINELQQENKQQQQQSQQ